MDAMRLIVSIVERGKGAALQKLYRKNQVFLHVQCPGRGTATSEILDILGLDSREKDVVFSYAEASVAQRLLADLNNDLRRQANTSGIVFDLPLTGLSNLIASAIDYQTRQTRNRNGGDAPMEGSKQSMIVVTCARGCADQIMTTAKAEGARGGTVIRARWSGLEEIESGYYLELSPERDLVAIVVPEAKRAGIMEAINTNHGLRTPEQAMVCSLPVGQVVRL